MPTVVSVFGVEPFRIGGTETLARELSLQLGQCGWHSVLCFLTPPPERVRRFLDMPNVSVETLDNVTEMRLGPLKSLAKLLRAYRPKILHLHFTGLLHPYPWLGRLFSVEQVFFTDHNSRPVDYVPHRAPFWKRQIVRAVNEPISKVICVSNYGYHCITTLDLLPIKRYELVYNGVDLSRVANAPERAAAFRERHAIPADRRVVAQVSWMIPEKGIPDLLEAARLVISKRQDVQFVLVGEGPYREQYMRDASAMGLGDRVTWTGLVEDPIAEGVFAAAPPSSTV